MKPETRENDQFTRLHGEFMPRLYRVAFYLLGDTDAAQSVAAQAWLAVYRDDNCRTDERIFAAHAEQMLVTLCASLAKSTAVYTVATADGAQQPLLQLLAGLGFNDRALLVLAAVCGRSSHEISIILGQPRLLVELRLAGVTQGTGKINRRLFEKSLSKTLI